jgi:hypothetical protein
LLMPLLLTGLCTGSVGAEDTKPRELTLPSPVRQSLVHAPV